MEHLEARVVLAASGFAGNACAPNLDLSNVATQEIAAGQTLTLDLLANGGTVVDLNAEGNATGDIIRFQLDPDIGTDTPVGASITPEGVFSWTPSNEQVGTFQIVVITVDQGTPPLADAELFTIVVAAPTNPIIDLNGAEPGLDVEVNFVEDGGEVLVGENLTVTDPDSADLTSVTIRLVERPDGEAETLNVAKLGTPIAGEYNPVTGELLLSGSQPIEIYQQILRTVTYDNASQNPDTSPRTVEFTISDGTFISQVATATILVEAVNDSPTLDLNGAAEGEDSSATFVEDEGPVSIAADATVNDVDHDTLESATIRISNQLDGVGELLAATTEGTAIEANYIALTGTLTLSGVDSVANYQQVLRSITYDNSRQNANTTTRSIEVVLNDGLDDSAVRISAVSLVAVNDAPNLSPIEDRDAVVGQLLEVPLTATDVDGDVLTFQLDRDDPDASTPASAVIVNGPMNGQAVIQWTPAAEDGTGPFTFVVLATDNDEAEPLSDRESFTVSLAAGSGQPELDLNGGAEGTGFDTSFTEGGGSVSVVGADLSIAAASSNLVAATAKIDNLLDGESESLSVETDATAISAVYDAVTGQLTLSGTDSVANYRQVLGTLRYDNAAEAPSTEARTIAVTVDDGTSLSNPATSTVEIIAQNDPPNLTLPAPFDVPAPVERPLGEPISFTVGATDPDSEDGDLVFILDLDNSGLEPGNAQPLITSPPDAIPGGDFTWTPDAAGVFVITVIAIDADGMSDQETFSVEVTAAAVAAALSDDDAIDAVFALANE